jgi:hypothetical protein
VKEESRSRNEEVYFSQYFKIIKLVRGGWVGCGRQEVILISIAPPSATCTLLLLPPLHSSILTPDPSLRKRNFHDLGSTLPVPTF